MPCYFCQRNVQVVDFKDIALLRRFISGMAKIRAKKKTGVCSKHQRKMALAVKRARFLGLLPYVVK